MARGQQSQQKRDAEQQSDPSNEKDAKDVGKTDDLKQVANPSLAQPKRDKALEEVREVNAANVLRSRYYGRTDTSFEIKGVPQDGEDDGGTLLIQTTGGHAYVSCSKKEIVLDHDGLADLQRNAQTVFQAAS